MFISYTYIEPYSLALNTFKYKVIDSDFEVVGSRVSGINNGWAHAILEVYEERNLPVARNLIRALLFMTYIPLGGRAYSKGSMDYWIAQWKRDAKMKPYVKDVERYLLLT